MRATVQTRRSIISAARDAALATAALDALAAANKPVEALMKLADFAIKITEAFNRDLSNVFVQDVEALQRLTPVIFAQSSSVFDPSLSTTNFDSTLNVTVLKSGVTMPTDFPVSLNAASFGL
jgi:hypothetical protein